MDVTLRIRRYNPEADEAPHWETYTVAAEPSDRVLDLLHQVKWYQDGTLTFRRSCAHGVCGSDAMLINGRNRLACEYLVKDAGTTISVEAMRGMAIVKDLLVDMEPFWDSFKQVMPFLVNDEAAGRRQGATPVAGRSRALRGHEPLHPVRRVHHQLPRLLGRSVRTSAPPPSSTRTGSSSTRATRAKQERLEIMSDPDGVWRCRTTFNCVEACPRDIKITRAILEVTQEIGKAGIG